MYASHFPSLEKVPPVAWATVISCPVGRCSRRSSGLASAVAVLVNCSVYDTQVPSLESA